jgi:hypothetical protein
VALRELGETEKAVTFSGRFAMGMDDEEEEDPWEDDGWLI